MRRVPYSHLDPGIRKLVRLLNDLGFETTDSGDGVSKVGAIARGHALDYPHVFIAATASTMKRRADMLMRRLRKEGIQVSPGQIQASYDPADGSAVIALMGIDDVALVRRRKAAEVKR